MEKKTVITDIETGKSVFSDYTLEQIEEVIKMDKEIQKDIEAIEIEPAVPEGVQKVRDIIENYPKAKEYLSDSESGEVTERIANGLVKLSETVNVPLKEVINTFNEAVGTVFILPFSVMLEKCCEDSRL